VKGVLDASVKQAADILVLIETATLAWTIINDVSKFRHLQRKHLFG
jgi:hypothetical protein